MLKVLSYILRDLDPKVKVIGQKAGICDGVPSTFALVQYATMLQRGPCISLEEEEVSFLNFETIRGSLMRPKWPKLASLTQKICTL